MGTGCQTTKIHTDRESKIYVNGELKAIDTSLALSKFGSPGAMEIYVSNPQGNKSLIIKREFTWKTLLGSLLTYGFGCLFLWELPDHIHITNGMLENQGDPWQEPKLGTPDPWLSKSW